MPEQALANMLALFGDSLQPLLDDISVVHATATVGVMQTVGEQRDAWGDVLKAAADAVERVRAIRKVYEVLVATPLASAALLAAR